MPLTITDIRAIQPSFSTVSDGVLLSVFESVELTLEKVLNRKLPYAVSMEWHPVESHRHIYLRRPPVVSIEYIDLVYFGHRSFMSPRGTHNHSCYKRSNQHGHVWIDRPYVFTPESGTVSLLEHPCHLKRDPRAWYAVKYTGGFDPIPADLMLAIAIMMQHRLAVINGSVQNQLASRERIGDYEIEYRTSGPALGASAGMATKLGPGGDQVAALVYPYIRSGVNGI